MIRSIRLLSFDLDDTLWPCAPTILRAENSLFQWLMKHVPVITQRYDIDQLREKRSALTVSHPELSHDLSALRIRSFELLAHEFALSDDWIKPAFEVFYEARQQITLFDDVKPVLDNLNKNFRLASLTNGNASTVKTGVDHWFDFSLSSATAGRLKSEPHIYRQAQQLAKIQAHEMIHIGDDPVNDVAGAKSAGVFAIWLNRQQQAWQLACCQPDATIHSLHQLPALLESLQAGDSRR